MRNRPLLALAILTHAYGARSDEAVQTPDEAVQAPAEPEALARASFTLNKNDGTQVQAEAEVRPGEDAAAAAVIFAERHSMNDIGSVLQIAERVVQVMREQAPNYEPPAELRLRTAGAHKRKAEELAKEADAHDEAAAHLVRALMRQGLEESMVETLKQRFGVQMERLAQQRKQEAAEAAEAAAAAARQAEEAAALVEARARAEAVEEDWRSHLASIKSVAQPAASDVAAEPLVAVPLTMRRANADAGGESTEQEVVLRLMPGQDVASAAYAFCRAQGLHSADELVKLGTILGERLAAAGIPPPPPPQQQQQMQQAAVAARGGSGRADSASSHVQRAEAARKEGAHAEAGASFARALQHPDAASLGESGLEAARRGLVEMMQADTRFAPILEAVLAEQWEAALALLDKVPRDERSVPRLQLLEARAAQKLGRWSNAQRAAARVVEAMASYTPWVRGEPRMLAVALGSAAALELGDGKKALDFLQKVLQFDPDQAEIRKQYKQLKELLKLLADAETHVTKGYNHKAVAALEDVLHKMRGMAVGSSLFRAQVLLKLCRASSSMQKHEEAMNDCQTAYKALAEPGPGVHVSPVRVREALEARAVAHENDKNYDDAVADLRAALEQAGEGTEKANELRQGLQRVQELQRKWSCIDPTDRQAWQQNRCGPFRPENGRDHKVVLELPANLDQLKREDQCGWVTRQYRKLARKWHPDRYKGLKVRAERKMRECSEAKEVLVKQLRCSAGGER